MLILKTKSADNKKACKISLHAVCPIHAEPGYIPFRKKHVDPDQLKNKKVISKLRFYSNLSALSV